MSNKVSNKKTPPEHGVEPEQGKLQGFARKIGHRLLLYPLNPELQWTDGAPCLALGLQLLLSFFFALVLFLEGEALPGGRVNLGRWLFGCSQDEGAGGQALA